MDDEKRPANLAGMFIGGQVPFELVGLIFKAFYSAGINPSSFELAPIYTDANVAAAVEEMGRKLSNGGVPQITDQSPKRKITRPPLGGGMKGYILALINVSPRKKDELRRLVQAKGQWEPKSLDARVYDLTAEKKIHKDADDFYHITKKGIAVVAPKAEEGAAPKQVRRIFKKPKGASTNVQLVLSLLEKSYPDPMTLKKLRTIFKSKDRRPESASVVLHVLKAKGLIEVTEPATYRFVPQPNQETQSDVDVQPSHS